MKLCDRCPQAGSCLLNYLGKACHKLRSPATFLESSGASAQCVCLGLTKAGYDLL